MAILWKNEEHQRVLRSIMVVARRKDVSVVDIFGNIVKIEDVWGERERVL